MNLSLPRTYTDICGCISTNIEFLIHLQEYGLSLGTILECVANQWRFAFGLTDEQRQSFLSRHQKHAEEIMRVHEMK